MHTQTDEIPASSLPRSLRSGALTAGRTPLPADGDAALVEGLLADDPAAWRAFNRDFSRLVYRCITRVTARFSAVVGPDDVREIHAMLFVQLLANDKKKLRTFEFGRGNRFSSWIGMLAIHTTYDHLRALRREPKRASITEAEGLVAESADPFEVCVARERAQQVAALLDEFSSKDRQFIQLYYGHGMDPEQIAKRMGISVKTVYSKKHKIRARLEGLMAERRLAA